MSQVQDPELSLLGTQLDELQTLLERRLDEERQTRQQTLVGLERWISDRLAERDRAISARLAEVTATTAAVLPIRNDGNRSQQVSGSATVVGAGANTDDLLTEISTLRERIASLEGQLAFIGARQDEFTVLLATVREWVVKHPEVD